MQPQRSSAVEGLTVQPSRRELIAAATLAPIASLLPSSAPQEANIKLGTVTYNVAKTWDLGTLLSHCKAAKLTGVEFRTTHAHGVEPACDKARRAEIKRLCAEAGMLQTSLGTTCEFQSTDAAVVRQNIQTCREFVQLAADIGARGVKVRPNGLPKGVETTKTLDQISAALRECGAFAKEHGVEIWVEVHGDGTSRPEHCATLMRQCGHDSVGLTWNSNGTDIVDGSIVSSFKLLRPYIRCCHINDLWGSYPYRVLFDLLKSSGYRGYTLCEIGATMQPEDGVTFLKCYHALWTELQRT